MGFLLNGAPDQPRITRDGGIVAGVRDLNQPIGWDPVTIDWTVNKVAFAGGGTFWMPPAFNPFHRAGTTILTGPQTEWLRSATAEDLPGASPAGATGSTSAGLCPPSAPQVD